MTKMLSPIEQLRLRHLIYSKSNVLKMHNVGIVVESLDDTIAFFAEPGLELSRFLSPSTVTDQRNDPVNALGYLRVMFTVEDIDGLVSRLSKHGAQRVGEIVQYENVYRLCYIRGPEGIPIGLAEELVT